MVIARLSWTAHLREISFSRWQKFDIPDSGSVPRGSSFLLYSPNGFDAACRFVQGLTLVISPLIALMKDQVDGLVECQRLRYNWNHFRCVRLGLRLSSRPGAVLSRMPHQVGQNNCRRSGNTHRTVERAVRLLISSGGIAQKVHRRDSNLLMTWIVTA